MKYQSYSLTIILKSAYDEGLLIEGQQPQFCYHHVVNEAIEIINCFKTSNSILTICDIEKRTRIHAHSITCILRQLIYLGIVEKCDADMYYRLVSR